MLERKSPLRNLSEASLGVLQWLRQRLKLCLPSSKGKWLSERDSLLFVHSVENASKRPTFARRSWLCRGNELPKGADNRCLPDAKPIFARLGRSVPLLIAEDKLCFRRGVLLSRLAMLPCAKLISYDFKRLQLLAELPPLHALVRLLLPPAELKWRLIAAVMIIGLGFVLRVLGLTPLTLGALLSRKRELRKLRSEESKLKGDIRLCLPKEGDRKLLVRELKQSSLPVPELSSRDRLLSKEDRLLRLSVNANSRQGDVLLRPRPLLPRRRPRLSALQS